MANKDPVKVGVLYSETGVTSAIESSQLLGTLLAIEDINEFTVIIFRKKNIVM